jgi:ankyrin repeat protein
MFLERGAVIGARNKDGRTPLHWAAQNGEKKVVQLFLEHGADVNARNESGKTLSELASGNGHYEIKELLCMSPSP